MNVNKVLYPTVLNFLKYTIYVLLIVLCSLKLGKVRFSIYKISCNVFESKILAEKLYLKSLVGALTFDNSTTN